MPFAAVQLRNLLTVSVELKKYFCKAFSFLKKSIFFEFNSLEKLYNLLICRPRIHFIICLRFKPKHE